MPMNLKDSHSTQYEKVAQGLSQDGMVVMDNFISEEVVDGLCARIHEYDHARRFHRAEVGHGINRQAILDVRRDRVMWIEQHDVTGQLAQVNQDLYALKDYLNRTCYLGIQDVEMHFAIYEPGGFYQRHLDQFKDNGNRVLTFILYLNIGWQPDHGGQLRIYLSDNDVKEIEPIAGRLVCFRSDVIEHEVVLAHHQRFTLTGWFLKKSIGLKNLV